MKAPSLADSRVRARVNLGLLGLVLVTAVADGYSAPPVARGLVTVLAVALVPGAVVVLWLGPSEPLAAASIAVGISIAVDICASFVMVLLHWWHPEIAAGAIGMAAVVFFTDDLLFSIRISRGRSMR